MARLITAARRTRLQPLLAGGPGRGIGPAVLEDPGYDGWAVAAAVASALCYALAAALQHGEAGHAPGDRRSGCGCYGIYAANRAGLSALRQWPGRRLHTLALSFGPLQLVQPIGAAGLLFALPLGARLHRARMRACGTGGPRRCRRRA